MNEIRKQIVLTTARASYLSEQPDTTDSIMHRTNADTMEKMLAVVETGQEIHDWQWKYRKTYKSVEASVDDLTLIIARLSDALAALNRKS